MTTYSLIFNPGTPNEYREENELTLEDALEQCETIRENDPSADVLPVENKQQ